jgi:hypothetical protein
VVILKIYFLNQFSPEINDLPKTYRLIQNNVMLPVPGGRRNTVVAFVYIGSTCASIGCLAQ